MRITVLAGGVGAARFLRGVLAAFPDADIAVIGNTADDIWLHGLKICPDLDTVMYTLGGGIDPDRGWGRSQETYGVLEELRAYDFDPLWFTLGDRDIATHLVRTQLLSGGFPLSEITDALCRRWQPGVRLLPMTDDRVETHVVVREDDSRRAMHFQQWWVQHRAQLPAEEFRFIGVDESRPAPGVLEAIGRADVVVLPPSNPVVSIGPILAVPGIRAAVEQGPAPVVGVSGIIGGRPVKGMADTCLAVIGVPATAAAVAEHYGPRGHGGILDGWVHETGDEPPATIPRNLATSTLMTDQESAATLAEQAVGLVL
ncbi:MAG TPA: 2-phospho-L-lactate transferase [Actinomycetota bacterium]|nr:2-phospho-L-lactate transferase [Actinomycetota bacterium]